MSLLLVLVSAVAAEENRPELPEGSTVAFDERFSSGGPKVPTFTRLEVVELVSHLGSQLTDPGVTASATTPAVEPLGRIILAEPKGPEKVLKDLLNTPIKELLLPRAEAGEETRPVLEATPSQDTVEAINPEPHLPATAQRPAGVPPGDPTRAAASRPPEVEAKAGDDFRPEVNERPIASGRATFYEHPGRTASGEIFNPNELTAAHHTLPLGTRVRVVNEETGESVVVRINDRIPRTAKILIDLSRASAQAIRLPGAGQVTLYLAGDTWPGSTLRASSGSEQPPEGYDVQVTGSVSTEPAPQLARAERLLRLGDVAGARLVLEHIRLQGDPVATRRLAQTYDPDHLGAWRVVGLKGDPDKARQLYELAARTALNGNRSDLP